MDKFILATIFLKGLAKLNKEVVSCLHYGRSEKQAYRSVNNLVNRCSLQWAEGL